MKMPGEERSAGGSEGCPRAQQRSPAEKAQDGGCIKASRLRRGSLLCSQQLFVSTERSRGKEKALE